MSHCKCCHFNDTSYHTESSNNLSHVNNGAHYNCNSNTSGTTFQYDQDVLQTSPPISQTEWGSSEYYRQEGVHFNPAPSNVYKPMVYNTPPEEMLHALLREQSDDYYYSPYKNSATGTPLSPMSMQSIDSFDTVQSPKFEGLISSPNIRASYISSTQTTQKNSLYYVGNPSAVQDIYFHQQDFKRHHNTEHQDQYQLQLQYEFEQQQNLLHNTLDNPQYNTLPSHQHQYNQQQQQQQLSRNNNDRRRYNNTQHLTTHQHNNCSTNIKACSENSKHPLENNEKVQHKHKRNSSRRTSPSQLICPTCSRKFTRPYNLKSHQRTHTKERPYVCVRPGCTWTFARPHDLKRHDLLHSGIKKYVCSCGKPFARSDAFKRHQAVDKVCSLRLKGNYI